MRVRLVSMMLAHEEVGYVSLEADAEMLESTVVGPSGMILAPLARRRHEWVACNAYHQSCIDVGPTNVPKRLLHTRVTEQQ